jgi:hypothetical protein
MADRPLRGRITPAEGMRLAAWERQHRARAMPASADERGFDCALRAMRTGVRVRRRAWHPDSRVEIDAGEGDGAHFRVTRPWGTPTSSVWAASHDDLLARDWEVAPPDARPLPDLLQLTDAVGTV